MSQAFASVLIIGGGLAGIESALSLRRLGWRGAVTIVNAEIELPYDRPPLSKGVLLGKTDVARICLRPAELYAELDINILADRRAVSLDVQRRRLMLSDGLELEYHALIFATGATPRKLQVPGSALRGVVTLRTLSDSLELKSSLVAGTQLTVAGGGYLGLEVAAAAAQMGVHVTVIEAGHRLLQRSGSQSLSRIVATRLEQAGVVINLEESVSCFRGGTRLEAVETSRGRKIETDIALVAIGAVPNDELARKAGLSGSGGIQVDGQAQTAAQNIYAVGDCANFWDSRFGCHARLESVQSATWQARTAAAAITGTSLPKLRHAYFWSELFDLKIQIAGFADPAMSSHDELVGSDAEGFVIYRFQRGKLAAVECVNRPADYVKAQLLIGRAAENLTDLKDAKLES